MNKNMLRNLFIMNGSDDIIENGSYINLENRYKRLMLSKMMLFIFLHIMKHINTEYELR